MIDGPGLASSLQHWQKYKHSPSPLPHYFKPHHLTKPVSLSIIIKIKLIQPGGLCVCTQRSSILDFNLDCGRHLNAPQFNVYWTHNFSGNDASQLNFGFGQARPQTGRNKSLSWCSTSTSNITFTTSTITSTLTTISTLQHHFITRQCFHWIKVGLVCGALLCVAVQTKHKVSQYWVKYYLLFTFYW